MSPDDLAELRQQREQILEMLDPAVRAALEIEARGDPDQLRILLADEIFFVDVNIDDTPEQIAAAINRAAQELACDDRRGHDQTLNRRRAGPMANFISQTDIDNYGRELIDLTQRAAAEVVAPQLAAMHEDNAALRQRLAIEARHRLDSQVAAAVPNFREIDRDPAWHQWLLSIDPLSGQQRQVLLNQAIAESQAARVIGFFRGFQREAGADTSQPSEQQRSRRMPMWSSERPTYTRAQIAKLYRQHAQGAYNGREAEWQRQEADIIAAGREGRIANPEAVGVK